jgi:hypothetical protein
MSYLHQPISEPWQLTMMFWTSIFFG